MRGDSDPIALTSTEMLKVVVAACVLAPIGPKAMEHVTYVALASGPLLGALDLWAWLVLFSCSILALPPYMRNWTCYYDEDPP